MLSDSIRSNNYAHPTRKPILARVVLAASAAALVCALGASSAQADRYIYWSAGLQTGYIARANIGGTEANTTYLSAGPGSGFPAGVAVTASKIYWRDGSLNSSGTLFTASLDGSVSAALPVTIPATRPATSEGPVGPALGGPGGPSGSKFGPSVAADANYYYYTILDSAGFGSSKIGRIGVDGTGRNDSLITGIVGGEPGVSGLAVDSTYIYWADSGAGKIGRANLNGTNPDANFITGLTSPSGLAVNATHIFWGGAQYSPATTSIGRAKINGTDTEANFITGVNRPAAVAIDSKNIFWTNASTGTIGRASINGTGADPSFVAGAFETNMRNYGLAVTPEPTSSAPSAPTGLVATPGNASASIAFTAGADNGSAITNYEYQLSTGAGSGPWTALNPADTTTPVRISGLTNGTTYSVRLRAINGAGDGRGAQSDPVSVTPVAPVVPPAKPAVVWSPSTKVATVVALITPVPGVTFTLTAKRGSVTKTGSCKDVMVKQGKTKIARRSCTVKLAKGTWVASVTPSKGALKGTASTKSYKFK